MDLCSPGTDRVEVLDSVEIPAPGAQAFTPQVVKPFDNLGATNSDQEGFSAGTRRRSQGLAAQRTSGSEFLDCVSCQTV